MALQPKPHPSFEDWLEGERAAFDERHEYVDGEVFLMSGGSAEHHAIIGNIFGRSVPRPRAAPAMSTDRGCGCKSRPRMPASTRT